jgi:hypothetical protein
VNLYDGSTFVGTILCTGGSWSWTGPLSLGRHTLTATQSEPVLGLTSSSSRSDTVTVYNPTPAPTVSAPANVPLSFTLTGTGVTGDTVYLYDGSSLVTKFKITASSGSWSVSLSLSAGTHVLSATEVDPVSTLVSDASDPIVVNAIATPSAPTLSVASISTSPVTVSGSCTSGDTVTLYDGSTVVSTILCTSGSWSWTGPLGLGRHTLTATQSEPVIGLTSSSSRSDTVTVYNPTPAPTVSAPANAPTTFTVSGTGVTGDTVYLYDGSSLVAKFKVTASSGSWSVSLSLSAGTHVLSATEVDPVSTLVSDSSAPVTVNGVATPSTPALSVPSVSTQTVTASGSCTSGNTVTLSDGSTVLASIACTDGGTWSWTGTLSLGRHTLSVTQSEPVLGLTSSSRSATVTVYAPPGAPTLSASAPNGARVSVSGTCVSGDRVQIYDGDTLIATVNCSRSSWSTTLTLANGTHALSASQVDGTSGLEGARSAVVTTTVVAPPPAPTMSVPSMSDASVPVTGTGVAGDTITVSWGSWNSVTTTVAANGTWSVSLSLSWGFYTISATQSDALGQTSGSVSDWVYVGF